MINKKVLMVTQDGKYFLGEVNDDRKHEQEIDTLNLSVSQDETSSQKTVQKKGKKSGNNNSNNSKGK
jgi:hypothetical protein